MRNTLIGGAMAMSLAVLPAAALAQDDMVDDGMVPHPSHIHVGACPAPGDVVAPLSDVGVVGNDPQGAEEHVHVDLGQTTVEFALDDIIAADHAIVVHQSADDMGTYLACGNIGGHDVDGSFLVGLGAVGDSGYSGIAWLADNGDGMTDVTVTISHSGATESMDMADDEMSDDDTSEDAMATDDMSDDDADEDTDG